MWSTLASTVVSIFTLVMLSIRATEDRNESLNLEAELCQIAEIIGIPPFFVRCNTSHFERAEPRHRTAGAPTSTRLIEQVEDPDMFDRLRLSMGMTPELSRLIERYPMLYYDLKIKFAYRFLLRNQPCNFTEFSLLMPEFWEDYFEGTADEEEQAQFGYRFWNISVQFDMNETEAHVIGHCIHQEIVEACTVQKDAQLARERDLCFSGGLLECSNVTNTCACLTNYGTKTVRANHTTGHPDPNGTACFVELGQPCVVKHYGVPDLKLPCVNHVLCDTYTGKCQKEQIAY